MSLKNNNILKRYTESYIKINVIDNHLIMFTTNQHAKCSAKERS